MLCNTLIIDTRKELPAKYKKSISDKDTTVFVTGNIKEALLYIQTREPDLIIISDSIPLSLSDFCEKIRMLTYNIRPVIIALSKSDNIDDKIKVLEAGADDYIGEPVNVKEFQIRIKAHLRRELESNLENKTLLPNKKYSIRTLKRILADEADWAALLIGIENFSHYVDVYTEFAGDKVIQTLVAIINSAMTETDFLSRISETEFLLITKSAAAERFASYLTSAFDMIAEKFYSHEDTKRGYILLKSDDEAGVRIDFVSLLIGVISSEFDKYSNPDHLLDKLRRIKQIAKLPSKSNYIVDRPKLSGSANKKTGYNKKIVITEDDPSLALLLRTTLELQGYDVVTDIEEDSVPAVFIIDSGDNTDRLKLCEDIKHNPVFVHAKVIMTSNIHDKIAVLNAGADLYLPKPYELSTLLRWVEYFIKIIND